ncbi:huntingtin [Nephila pilipes]|uniref:Huntingtin n=1 Tax=Nephila pilipes TaxID=299642 RepID=A0A8X6NWV4_NEPPI|nr:huntingtin [Nephila pilipes]
MMATMDKLMKALEALKVIQPPNNADDSIGQKKKEILANVKDKILHCSTIADAICSPTLRSSADFPKVLGLAMDTFLLCCDDENSDVRLMADECLNRTIKTLLDSHLGRLLVELFKEIKKNGSARSLRAALSRFGDICHLMRPQKCRPYTVNLVPALAKICQRNNEELVQETLALAINKLLPVLGQFANDKEVKVLLKAFLPNLIVSSAIVRRAAASSLTAICLYSRRPSSFFSWILLALFDLILPVHEEHSVYVILGVLLCLRHVVPHLNEAMMSPNSKGNTVIQNEEEMVVTKEQLLKIYELVLYFTNHPDHNVITATLETLYHMLKCAPKVLQQELVSPFGITKSLIFDVPKLNRAMSESQYSMVPSLASIDEAALEDDQDIFVPDKQTADRLSDCDDEVRSNLDRSKDGSLSLDGDYGISDNSNMKSKVTNEEELDYLLSHTEISPFTLLKPPFLKKDTSDENILDSDEELWENSTSSSPGPVSKVEFKVGNIGTFTDHDVALKYCTRLLCSSFLLTGTPGYCIPDRNVRISVKSLALGCLSSIFSLYPNGFLLPLHLNTGSTDNNNIDEQRVWDVILYSTHSDPHIRGQTCVMIGSFLGHALREAGGLWSKWICSQINTDAPSLPCLLSNILSIVQDDSSVASKLGLVGLKQCLNALLNSVDAIESFPILEALLKVQSNSYWLTKVELTELVSSIPFKIIHYLESKHVSSNSLSVNICYQDKVLNDILIPLLGDEDVRVRHSAAVAFSRLVSKLFYPIDHLNKDPVIAIAKEAVNTYLDVSHKGSMHTSLPLVHALVKPFAVYDSISYNPVIDAALSKIINLLVDTLRMCSNKYLVYGCCHALCLLSEKFLVTIFPETWIAVTSNFKMENTSYDAIESSFINLQDPNINYPSKQNTDLVCHLISFVTSTSSCLDLIAHQHVLQLTGNLLCGMWYKYFVENHKSSNGNLQDVKSDAYISFIIGKVFHHLMKVLNIFTHVLEDQYPFPASSRSALPSLPNAPSLSPIKRKNKVKDESPTSSNIIKGSPSKGIEKSDAEKERISSKMSGNVGQFHNSPLYMKLFEILKGAHSSYKISMDFQSSEKFCQLLRCVLDVMCQMLEISDSSEMSKNAEEMLCYMKSVMVMEASSAVRCVRQLLKCLFGTNLIVLCQEAQLVMGLNKKGVSSSRLSSSLPGLYYTILSYPYTDFTHSLAEKAMKSVSSDTSDDLVRCLNWVKRGNEKVTSLLKSGTKGEKANLASHIRLFEGVVIRALQQYTISSDINLQCQVLDLLAQLVQLRVNYCLLDADQIFISHVIKQFEFIEEGQILSADVLIPRIFYFLILLSYERYHSKPIISVPKILQLCDGLIASGQSPEKYIIPALQPVIEDLFLLRSMNKMDVGKELDAQREVVISTLFKLVYYPQVLELFFLIIKHSHQEGEDKWRKTSRQVVDVILPLLSRQQIQIENQEELNILHKLLEAVASNVFRPVDILLKALFSQPKDLTIPPNINRWMCMVLTVLRLLISQANEEAVLSRLADMGITIKIYKLGLSPSLRCEKEQADSCITNSSAEFLPGAIFSRFLFQVLGVVVESLCNHAYMHTLHFSDNLFLCQQAAHLLLYLTYMFQSGTFRRLTTSAMSIIKDDLNAQEMPSDYPVYYTIYEIEHLFHKIAPFYPTLVIQWCNILTLLNYDNRKFWSKIVQPYQEPEDIEPTTISMQSAEKNDAFLPCHLEMVHRGGIILLCDYVCENPTDVVQMTWLIVNHVNDIIDLSLETTVQDFISAIHRNPAASGLWIQAIINAHHKALRKPKFWKQALLCLENIHLSQSGKLLSLLVDHFFSTHHLIVSSMCDRLACKRMEILLSEPSACQLSIQDIEKFINNLKSSGISRRYPNFISLCEKMKVLLSEEESPTSAHPLVEPMIQIQHVELNKDWYLKFVKEKCFNCHSPAKECAHFLSHLKYEDILTIMVSKDFQLPILEQCLLLGAKLISSTEKYLSTKSNDPFLGITESPGSALYRSAQSTLLQHLADFMTLLPRASKHQNRMHKLFSEKSFWEILFFIVPSTCSFLVTQDLLLDRNIPSDSSDDIVHLSAICCEAIVWLIETSKSISSEMLRITLFLLDKTLKNTELSSVIGSPSNTSKICSTISSVHHLMKYLQQDKNSVIQPDLVENSSLTAEQRQAWKACVHMAEMISWLEMSGSYQIDVSEHLFNPLKSVIRGLARLPLVNSFARAPPILWNLGWNPEFFGDFKTCIPTPSGEYLQDRDVLKQFIYRINLLGWISRQQFEETWMALLGVLSATPVDDIDGKEEDEERIRTSCLAVKSITSLLLQTLLLPQPGNPQNSYFLLQPRDKPLAFQHTKCGKKLMCVRLPIHSALQKLLRFERYEEQILNVNTERIASLDSYSLSQVSLEYLNAAAGLVEDNEDLDGSASSNSSPLSTNVGGIASFQLREQCLTAVGLDIHSCLHFLLDLYSQWLSPQTCPYTPLTLLTEVTKSVVALSDIFMEKTQFEWMLDTFLEVQIIHPAEDEVIAQYLIFGICKAVAVLGIEQDILDKLKKLLELSLKSTYLPTKISSLHGLLYLLEQGGGDESFPLLPTATEYILKHLDTTDSSKPCNDNEDHILILWAVTFYIMENYQEEISEEFSQKIYQICLNVCGSSEECVSSAVYLTVLHGLERLLVAEILTGKEANVLLKLTVDRIRSGTPVFSMAALGFFLSCMYIGKSTNMWSNELVPDVSKPPDRSQASGKQMDSEFLLVAMERVTTLFDKIKKAYPFEAEIVCEILPGFLMEFFPVQEILNKIITEFLSSQQPHPQLMAKVIFEVFQYLHKQSQEEVIHEWVLLSLSNFMQRSPLSMAIWSLSCFFVSATKNYWFQALFPHIQNRMGKMEEQDQVLFCIAGVNFRDQLHNDEQKQAYFNTIQSVAAPQTPYADLLSCL